MQAEQHAPPTAVPSGTTMRPTPRPAVAPSRGIWLIDVNGGTVEVLQRGAAPAADHPCPGLDRQLRIDIASVGQAADALAPGSGATVIEDLRRTLVETTGEADGLLAVVGMAATVTLATSTARDAFAARLETAWRAARRLPVGYAAA